MPALASFLETTQVIEGESHPVRGGHRPFMRVAGMLMPDNHNLPQPVVNWLDKLLQTPGTAEALASKTGPLSDTDPRIREYTLKERNTNLEWMKLGAEISSMGMVVEVGSIYLNCMFEALTFLRISGNDFCNQGRSSHHHRRWKRH